MTPCHSHQPICSESSPRLCSAPPLKMRQLVNWITGARAAPCPPRILSPAEPEAPGSGLAHVTLS